MSVKLVIFDMDGTILDTLRDLADTLNYALKKAGLPERSLEEVRAFVGNGILRLVELGVPAGSSDETVAQVFAVFNDYYQAHCADHTRPYDGIVEVIRKLRDSGLKTAVVSNKADFAVRELESVYFEGLFDLCLGAKEGIRKKPAPDAVNAVLQALNVPRENALYVGDSDVDLQTAENAGVPCISVTWGFRDRAFLLAHGAKTLIDRPEALFFHISNAQ